MSDFRFAVSGFSNGCRHLIDPFTADSIGSGLPPVKLLRFPRQPTFLLPILAQHGFRRQHVHRKEPHGTVAADNVVTVVRPVLPVTSPIVQLQLVVGIGRYPVLAASGEGRIAVAH